MENTTQEDIQDQATDLDTVLTVLDKLAKTLRAKFGKNRKMELNEKGE